MIVVTGGAGMIGSNIIRELNVQGYTDILVVDNLKDGTKFINLVGLDISDYIDKDEFIKLIQCGKFEKNIDVIFHQGACSSTTEWDGKYMLMNNYEYSKVLLHYCLERKIPFLYASSAATYGMTDTFVEHPDYEKPLNVYGYSKLIFDNYVRRLLSGTQSLVCGFRYFNVYGPGESHKGSMASVAYHLNEQIKNNTVPKLFEGSESFRRDFVYVKDVVDVNLWFWKNGKSGIYNCGTGRAESFQKVADAVLEYHAKSELEYIPFPDKLKGRYQAFTKADLSNLKSAGYKNNFRTVSEGVMEYMQYLNENK